jgi:hypothetical protein
MGRDRVAKRQNVYAYDKKKVEKVEEYSHDKDFQN